MLKKLDPEERNRYRLKGIFWRQRGERGHYQRLAPEDAEDSVTLKQALQVGEKQCQQAQQVSKS
eukprot:3381704-Prorocentrum_lima.AAC.1